MHEICDCHFHVFGPADRYPGAPDRTYSPAEMGLAQYGRAVAPLGIERGVIVQPSAYGTDNRCTLDALRERGGQARAVVVLPPGIGEDELSALDQLGVRGVRLNLMTPRTRDAEAAAGRLRAAARLIGHLGWHLQIYADLDLVALLAPAVRALPVPVVFDHLGGARAGQDPGDPRFRALLGLLADGRCWVKLSGADRAAGSDRDFAPAGPFARALLAANPRQLVWGTDWPHLADGHGGIGSAAPSADYRPVPERDLMAALEEWAGDDAVLRQVLDDNPERLYGF